MRVVRETIVTEMEMVWLNAYAENILECTSNLARKHKLDKDNDLVSAIYIILNNAEGLKKMLKGE